MDIQITVAIIGVASALFGSAIGALASYFSTRSMRKLEWKLSQIDQEIQKRESLYAEFLSEANKGITQSFHSKISSISEMNNLLNLESRIRLMSPKIGESARKIAACVLDHHEKEKNATGTYPALRDFFISECRSEIDSLRIDT